VGHFGTKSDAYRRVYGLILLQVLTFWRSASNVGARGSWLFDAAPAIVVQFGAINLSMSPISKLRACTDEQRQAKRNSLADKLTVEAKDPLAIALIAASAHRSTTL
jgi:hypothetical protein